MRIEKSFCYVTVNAYWLPSVLVSGFRKTLAHYRIDVDNNPFLDFSQVAGIAIADTAQAVDTVATVRFALMPR